MPTPPLGCRFFSSPAALRRALSVCVCVCVVFPQAAGRTDFQVKAPHLTCRSPGSASTRLLTFVCFPRQRRDRRAAAVADAPQAGR